MSNIIGNTNNEQKLVAHNTPVYWHNLKNLVALITQLINWVNGYTPPSPGLLIVQDDEPLTGTTVISASNTNYLALNPAGTIATLDVNLPATVINGFPFSMNTTQTITALTLNALGGAPIQGYSTAFTMNANTTYRWIWNESQETWLIN